MAVVREEVEAGVSFGSGRVQSYWISCRYSNMLYERYDKSVPTRRLCLTDKFEDAYTGTICFCSIISPQWCFLQQFHPNFLMAFKTWYGSTSHFHSTFRIYWQQYQCATDKCRRLRNCSYRPLYSFEGLFDLGSKSNL